MASVMGDLEQVDRYLPAFTCQLREPLGRLERFWVDQILYKL